MSTDLIQTVGKYIVAIIILAGCFYIIAASAATANVTAPWGTIGLIVGWIVRDSAGQQATTNAVKTIAAANAAPPATQ